MRQRSFWPALLSANVLMLAACGEEPTQPAQVTAPAATDPALAVASNTWVKRANMWSVERWSLTAAAVTNAAGQSVLYAIGGRSAAGGPVSKVMAYNVATNTWSVKAPLPVPLWGMNQAAVLDGKIYVSGGCRSVQCAYNPPSDMLFVYDPAADTWTRKQSMPTLERTEPDGFSEFAGTDGVSGVIAGKLYTLSNCYYGDAPLFLDCDPLFLRYNRRTDRWTVLPRPGVYPWAGGVIAGKFYALHMAYGSDDQVVVRTEVYDPATNRWTTRPPIPGDLGRGGVVMLGKLYTVRGDRLRVYDPVTHTIATRANLPSNRDGAAASKVFVNGQPRMEVVGGARPGNNLQYAP